MRYLIFISFILTMLLISSYTFYRLYIMLPKNRWLLATFLIAATLITLTFPLMIYGEHRFSIRINALLYSVSFGWGIIMIYFFLFFVVIDFVRLIDSFLHFFPKGSLQSITRENIYAFVVLVSAVTILGIYGIIHYYQKERVYIPLTIMTPNGNKTEPIRIVALSDLHLGYLVTNQELDKWISLVNQEKPDLLLILGDVIDNSLRPLNKESIRQSFAKVEAPLGVITILGNHEYLHKKNENIKFLQSLGITVLQDTTAIVGDYFIVGRDDRSNRGRRGLSMLATNNHDQALIVMDHQPHNIQESIDMNAALHLSGHSHRGQIWPYSWVTKMMYMVDYGFLTKENTHIIVSSGIGIFGAKFRIGTDSEYLVIDINSPNKNDLMK